MKTTPHNSSKSGVALLLVLMGLALMTILIVEIVFASRVELRISRNARNRLQSVYLAQSAARFALLRLHLYKAVQELKDSGKLGTIELSQNLIDQVWSQPIPSLPLATQAVDWPGEFSSVIISEGSKIPVNLLDGNQHRSSGAKEQEAVAKQLKDLFKGLAEDEEFFNRYRDLNVEDLIYSLQDWIDPDKNKVLGGEEDSDYAKANPPIFPRNDRIPVLSEILLIRGWTDDLFKRVKGELSVLNTRTEVNPNHMTLNRIKSMQPSLTTEDLAAIEKRRLEQPFKDLKELENFIQSDPAIRNGQGFSFGELKEDQREQVFYIEASGIVGDARRSLRLGVLMNAEPEKKAKNPTDPQNPSAPDPAKPEDTGDDKDKDKNKKKTKLTDPVVVTVEELL